MKIEICKRCGKIIGKNPIHTCCINTENKQQIKIENIYCHFEEELHCNRDCKACNQFRQIDLRKLIRR